MPEINWSLLGNFPDVGASIMQGFQTGQAMRQKQETKNALSAYVTNPDDPNAINALVQADPAMGMQARQQTVTMQQRQAEQQRAEQQRLIEQNRDRLTFGANLIEQVKPQDNTGWQQVLAGMRQAGHDISDIPTEYDPQYVDGVVKIGRSLNPPKEAQDPTMQREYEFILRTKGQKAADTFLENKTNPTQWIRTEDATGVHLTPVSRSGGGGGQPDIPVISSPEEASRLPPGTVFKTPDGRTKRVPGGASQNGSPTFP